MAKLSHPVSTALSERDILRLDRAVFNHPGLTRSSFLRLVLSKALDRYEAHVGLPEDDDPWSRHVSAPEEADLR